MTHDQKCENQTCKDNGLDKLKVVEVEYFGLDKNEVKTLKNSYESEDHDSISANLDNRRRCCCLS